MTSGSYRNCNREHLQTMCGDNHGGCIECSIIETGQETIEHLRVTKIELKEAKAELSRIQRLPTLDSARAGAIIMQEAAKAARFGAKINAEGIRDAVDQWRSYTSRVEAERDKYKRCVIRRKKEKAMSRAEWKFEYNGGQLLSASVKKSAHHNQRKEQWTLWLAEAKEKLEAAGVQLVEDEYTTGPASIQIKVDPQLQARYHNCREKIKDHDKQIDLYEMWVRAFTTNKHLTFELDVNDIDFFGL